MTAVSLALLGLSCLGWFLLLLAGVLGAGLWGACPWGRPSSVCGPCGPPSLTWPLFSLSSVPRPSQGSSPGAITAWGQQAACTCPQSQAKSHGGMAVDRAARAPPPPTSQPGGQSRGPRLPVSGAWALASAGPRHSPCWLLPCDGPSPLALWVQI